MTFLLGIAGGVLITLYFNDIKERWDDFQADRKQLKRGR